LTAGFGGETDLYLGNDDQFVKVDHSGTVVVQTYSTATTSTWTFGTDGNITFPDGTTNSGGTIITGGVYDIQSIGNTLIQTSANAGAKTWQFGTDGILTLPEASPVIKGGGTGTDVTVVATTGSNTATWVFSADGTLAFPDATVQTTAYKSTSGSWTLATGSNTVSITVPLNNNYQMWVNGNIPNGIVEWNATVNVSNPNVPAIGSQYAWYYAAGNALVLTDIPDQIVGTVGVISTATSYVGNTANVFTFGITNNSTSTQVVTWGYTTL
jgi:hypothetical protein